MHMILYIDPGFIGEFHNGAYFSNEEHDFDTGLKGLRAYELGSLRA